MVFFFSKQPESFPVLPQALKEEWLQQVSDDGNALMFAPPAMKNDAEVVLAAVEQSAGALQFASEEVKRNKEVGFVFLGGIWKVGWFTFFGLLPDCSRGFDHHRITDGISRDHKTTTILGCFQRESQNHDNIWLFPNRNHRI